VTITVPASIRTDRFVPVVVTHPTDGSSSTRQWWSKATTSALRSFLLAMQEPGDQEDWGAAASDEHPEDIEAKDIERLHELLRYLPTDALQAQGDMVGHGGAANVSRLTNGPHGSTVMLDHGTSGGAAGANHRTRRSGVLTWGRQVSNTTPTLMAGNGTATAGSSPAPEQATPNGGFATTFLFYVDRQGGTREVDQVELLVDGVVVHDSGTGQALAAQDFYTANVWVDAGALGVASRISVRMTADGGTSSVEALAALMVF